ncbi:hypothetical protein RFI_30571 [Reticulomyxa filosa]|uniref:Uncharacterized protein n=1 Tax=Reticulomyxa filosa TaxID=46433 RepID=X6M098_RETFI|nr:hypothetical protein RFI_30571 [Reticulomyxa filosa]|eukprot:ETO06822.1 hypothetical protein RFI_30571 [Reticulomyxa filosa]
MKLRIGNEAITVLFAKKRNKLWICQRICFYACQYDKTLMGSLTHELRNGAKNLNITDKICLMRYTLAVARVCNSQATKDLFNLIVLFENEITYSIWYIFLDAAQVVFNIINDDDVLAQSVTPRDRDEETHALLKHLTLRAMSKHGYQSVIDEALKRFKAFMNLKYIVYVETLIILILITFELNAYLAPALRNVVYSIEIEHGGIIKSETLFVNARLINLCEQFDEIILEKETTQQAPYEKNENNKT